MLPPETLLQQRYRIVRQLKQGGMGTVYEALDERLDSTVALKECHFTEEPLRKQFEREARLLARLRHPALTKVIDHFGEAAGQFLVMEFIPGEDLSEMMLERNAPFAQADALVWADQLLDALDYLHTHEPPIVHRDIKPQNLKLTKRGQIILLDFGLAKGFAGQISRVTASGSIFGYTPNYAPLEQIQGTGTDPRSDLYSLAATVYHLLTATSPPDALTRITAVANEQPDPLRPAHLLNPQVSLSASDVLSQAMSQNREKRPPSAARMRALLLEAAQAQAPFKNYQTVAETRTGDDAPPDARSTPTVSATPPPAAAPGRADAPPPKERTDPAPAHQTDPAAHRRLTSSPLFSDTYAEPSSAGFKWWWVAAPALVLLLAGFAIYSMSRGPASTSANRSVNTNGAAASPSNQNTLTAGVTASPAASLNARPSVNTQATPPNTKPTPKTEPTVKTEQNARPTVAPDDGPPRPTQTPPPKPSAPVAGGVLNGKAISKPSPPYPAIARAARASGTVTVQITVDEQGRVIAASAVNGHPLLQQAAVAAARQARFSPTLLSGQAVKVTGVITYNFVLQ